jgi:hypothetical protein
LLELEKLANEGWAGRDEANGIHDGRYLRSTVMVRQPYPGTMSG